MARYFTFLLATLSLVMVVVDISLAQSPVVVPTNNGQLRGFQQGGINYFLGVPFAAPPVGNLRWRPPQPAKSWTGIRDAFAFGPICVQEPPSESIPQLQISEDCLYLNVYAPAGASNLPVMVWIYGGSFTSGAGEFYDGTSLLNINGSSTDVVVVTLNYRLGPFGFLSLPELKNEDASYKTTGFYGIQDQRAALKWVKANIANFGGNPNNITLFGESAGAISICVHTAAPLSRGLYQRALLESGFCNVWPLETSENQGTQLSEVVGCAQYRNQSSSSFLSCLRKINSATLFTALPSNATWFPVVDGTELTMQPLDYLDKGSFSLDGLLLGINKNEDSLFLCPKYANITASQYPQLILAFFGIEVGQQVLKLYPGSAYPTPVEAAVNVFSDLIFKCPSKYMASAISRRGVPTYFYSFQHLPGFAVNEKCLGISHSFELPFIFPNLLPAFGNKYTFTAAERQLSDFMRTSWTNFAKANTPNYQGVSGWPNFDQNSADYIILDIPNGEGSDLLPAKCDFWRNHQCQIGGATCH